MRNIQRFTSLYLGDNQAMAALPARADFEPPQVNDGIAVTAKML
ncbi:MAG: hypothetical protein ABTR07_14395 [Candidatus Competibacter denitrificans]